MTQTVESEVADKWKLLYGIVYNKLLVKMWCSLETYVEVLKKYIYVFIHFFDQQIFIEYPGKEDTRDYGTVPAFKKRQL